MSLSARILRLMVGCVLFTGQAFAGNTTTLPAGTFLLDTHYLTSTTDVRWDDHRHAQTLIDGIARYEPGGGLQGTITGTPHVEYRIVTPQISYGITDHLTLGVATPYVRSSYIDPKLGWTPGDYQSQLGRSYTENDFWDWAKSMGQKKPGTFQGNNGVLADMVVGARYRLSDLSLFQEHDLEAAVGIQFALPTGHQPDPEELVAAGTTAWDLHNFGDFELHFALEKPLKVDGIMRLNAGIDLFYAVLRERTFVSPTGINNPLLMTYSPYIGSTYKIDPGDISGATVIVEGVPFIGPTWATWLAKGDISKAQTFPPLLTLQAGLTHGHVNQSTWTSDSALWNWDHEKLWMPGDKNTVKLSADVSLLRLGLPLILYTQYRNQEWVPGRNTRATDTFAVGARLLLKFW